MYRKTLTSTIGLFLILLAVSSISGCFDINVAKDAFFPSEDKEIVFVKDGTIAEARYNFTGPYVFQGYEVARYERHIEIENFYIGEGGGNLYLWVQVHFGVDTSPFVKLDRYLNVTLEYIPEGEDPQIRIHKRYEAPETGQYDISEWVGNIEDPEEGLWSLKVVGRGTAGEDFYDWFRITVNGDYPDTSYNNNPPQ